METAARQAREPGQAEKFLAHLPRSTPHKQTLRWRKLAAIVVKAAAWTGGGGACVYATARVAGGENG